MKKIYYKRKKASAILSTLLISLMVTSLVVTIITFSLKNLQMASKNMNSNIKYYDLDKLTQEVVTLLETSLSQADKQSLEYITSGKYKIEKLDSNDEVNKLLVNPNNHSMIYSKWKNDLSNKNITDPDYDAKLSAYIDGVHERVWGSMIEKSLKSLENDLLVKYNKRVHLKINSSKSYGPAISLADWDLYTLDKVNINATLNVYNISGYDTYDSMPEGTRYINCSLVPERAKYDGASRKFVVNNGIKPNPVWTNAIIATDTISINPGTTSINSFLTINGDVAGIKKNDIALDLLKATVNIDGNLFLGSKLNLKNSKLKVDRYNSSNKNNKPSRTISTLYKEHLYETKTYSDLTKLNDDGKYASNMYQYIYQSIEGTRYINSDSASYRPPETHILPDDTKGGNIYAASLKSDTSNFPIQVGGNVTALEVSQDNTTLIDAIRPNSSDKNNIVILNEILQEHVLYGGSSPYDEDVKKIISGINSNYGYGSFDNILYSTLNNIGNTIAISRLNDSYGFIKNKTIFKRKTQELGFYTNNATSSSNVLDCYMDTSKIKTGTVNDLTKDNPSLIRYSGTLDLPSGKELEGIIYSKGDLTITGNGGSFSGTIICDGKLTFNKANVTINYDEQVVRKVMNKDRDYFDSVFKKGEQGKTLPIEEFNNDPPREDFNPEARVCVKREGFKINSWSQKVK